VGLKESHGLLKEKRLYLECLKLFSTSLEDFSTITKRKIIIKILKFRTVIKNSFNLANNHPTRPSQTIQISNPLTLSNFT
jgi:hypothetical protein